MYYHQLLIKVHFCYLEYDFKVLLCKESDCIYWVIFFTWIVYCLILKSKIYYIPYSAVWLIKNKSILCWLIPCVRAYMIKLLQSGCEFIGFFPA